MISDRITELYYLKRRTSDEEAELARLQAEEQRAYVETVPDAVLYSVIGARRAAKRETPGRGGGRRKKLVKCPLCRATFGTAELRKHLPECRREQKKEKI